ncbi:ABC transporter permease [Cellulomonas marina]|uniref:ABC-2 type transport system permease protein n=1 Tax=Cellulomonas marina TaxID=988821 RepID=A0A1I0V4J1_9CELL|nr:ABC transporter permease subunit [Cellulomonas marina]GIG28328.1 ABC transporter permease [Cellulomonas marina]SFA71191.1 ABC-2 type transport system permease protein [Cellulomonas marina]
MSPADVAVPPAPPAGPAHRPLLPDAPAIRGAFLRLLRSELRLVLGRRRNQALLVGLSLVPLILGLVVRLTQDSALQGQGPGFIGEVTGNGLFLVVAALFVCLPFLLPLCIAIASGDAVAGEAQTGTLRYLLVVPVSRSRLLLVKAVGALVFAASCVAAIAVVAAVTGAALFGVRPLTLLSGDTVPLSDGALRVAGVALYVGLSFIGLVAVGLFFSTLTEVPVAAMAATVVVPVVSTVLDSLPQLDAIHPVLLTHHWFDFAEFLRVQVGWDVLAGGLALQAGWAVVFGSLAWARFTTADITS